MSGTRVTIGSILATVGLLFGVGFFALSVALRNAPVVGATGRGFQRFLVNHVVWFGAFVLLVTVVAFLGQVARARSERAARWLLASAFFLGAGWCFAGVLFDLADGVVVAKPLGAPPVERWIGLAFAAAVGLGLVLLGVRRLRAR